MNTVAVSPRFERTLQVLRGQLPEKLASVSAAGALAERAQIVQYLHAIGQGAVAAKIAVGGHVPEPREARSV